MCLLGKRDAEEDASALQSKDTRRHSSHSSQPGRYFPTGEWLVSGFGIWRTGTKDFSCRRESSLLAMMNNTDTIHSRESEAKCAESLHRRHIKRLAAEGT